MLRFLNILLVFFFCYSCNNVERKDVVEEFAIIGCSGFLIKDSANNIYDSTRLDIRTYFEFRKDIFVRIAKIYFNCLPEYYTVRNTDTMGFNKMLNKILLNKRYNDEYKSEGQWNYEGWLYILYFKTSKQMKKIIYYEPEYLEDSLKILHNYINNLVLSNNLQMTNKFIFNPLISEIATDLYKKYPPPPPSKKLSEEAIFVAPDNIDK